jgi:hypothetical protein
LTFTALTRSSAIAALALAALALTACGESSQEKAEAQVCSARAEISKQITTISGLTISTSSISQAKTSVEAIGKSLTKIKEAQPNLKPARKEQVEAATNTFESQFSSIVKGLGSNLSLSNAEAEFKSALTQLTTSYKQSLAPISCS